MAVELGLDKSEPVLGRCLKSPFKDKMAPSIISTEEKQLAFGLSLSLNVPLFSHSLSPSPSFQGPPLASPRVDGHSFRGVPLLEGAGFAIDDAECVTTDV